MEMEKENSETGQRGSRIARNDFRPDHNLLRPALPPPLRFVNYAGDVGLPACRPSELEIGMIISNLHHSGRLTDLHPHQDLIDRRHAVVSYLEEIAKEARASREENIGLKMVNADLTKLLNSMLSATLGLGQCPGPGQGSIMGSWPHGLRNMFLGDGVKEDGRSRGDYVEGDGESPSPDTVVDSDLVEGSENAEVNRVSLPKSISVRSDRKLKTVQSGGIHKQMVHVPGKEKKKQPVELEIYHQGTFKTELCNKWQGMGACPYGEKCRFAHGIKELRPVLRHPRYKTEVCRMLLNGNHCPYGHRCHFRHSLADEEKLIRSMNIRALKPLNQ